MDRNGWWMALNHLLKRVALRKESVDRNRPVAGYLTMIGGSLSARRAWIEIVAILISGSMMVVALRKESVDRNTNFSGGAGQLIKSLSARRAWIEILASRLADMSAAWSLSARRAWIEIA